VGIRQKYGLKFAKIIQNINKKQRPKGCMVGHPMKEEQLKIRKLAASIIYAKICLQRPKKT